MSVAAVKQVKERGLPKVNTRGLPDELTIAQNAIHLPEVQEILERLSEYNLGICMPHMHDENTGEFLVLPDNIMQVEAGMEVAFCSREEVESQMNKFIPVGWTWNKNSSNPSALCHTACEKRGTDTNHYNVHEKGSFLSSLSK